jgi:hypothetical protein
MVTRLQRKRTDRGLNSKHKRWLRNRGMYRQEEHLDHSVWNMTSMLDALRRPLRGVMAGVHDPPKRERFQKRPGFLSRIFRRVNA